MKSMKNLKIQDTHIEKEVIAELSDPFEKLRKQSSNITDFIKNTLTSLYGKEEAEKAFAELENSPPRLNGVSYFGIMSLLDTLTFDASEEQVVRFLAKYVNDDRKSIRQLIKNGDLDVFTTSVVTPDASDAAKYIVSTVMAESFAAGSQVAKEYVRQLTRKICRPLVSTLKKFSKISLNDFVKSGLDKECGFSQENMSKITAAEGYEFYEACQTIALTLLICAAYDVELTAELKMFVNYLDKEKDSIITLNSNAYAGAIRSQGWLESLEYDEENVPEGASKEERDDLEFEAIDEKHHTEPYYLGRLISESLCNYYGLKWDGWEDFECNGVPCTRIENLFELYDIDEAIEESLEKVDKKDILYAMTEALSRFTDLLGQTRTTSLNLLGIGLPTAEEAGEDLLDVKIQSNSDSGAPSKTTDEAAKKDEELEALKRQLAEVREQLAESNRKSNKKDAQIEAQRKLYEDEKSRAGENRQKLEKAAEDAVELAALRRFVAEINEMDDDDEKGVVFNLAEMKAYLKRKTITIVGGHDNFVSKMRAEFPNWQYRTEAELSSHAASEVEKSDYVFFFTSHISHSSYYKYVDWLRKHNRPFGYLYAVNVDRCIRQIYKEHKDYQMSKKGK